MSEAKTKNFERKIVCSVEYSRAVRRVGLEKRPVNLEIVITDHLKRAILEKKVCVGMGQRNRKGKIRH